MWGGGPPRPSGKKSRRSASRRARCTRVPYCNTRVRTRVRVHVYVDGRDQPKCTGCGTATPLCTSYDYTCTSTRTSTLGLSMTVLEDWVSFRYCNIAFPFLSSGLLRLVSGESHAWWGIGNRTLTTLRIPVRPATTQATMPPPRNPSSRRRPLLARASVVFTAAAASVADAAAVYRCVGNCTVPAPPRPAGIQGGAALCE